MKPIHWLGDSRRRLSAFPTGARAMTGYQLYRVQIGLEPADWKPMQSVGPGARELRIHVSGEWRVIYLAMRGEAVYVLHAFGKKTQRTARSDIELATSRLKQIDAARRSGR